MDDPMLTEVDELLDCTTSDFMKRTRQDLRKRLEKMGTFDFRTEEKGKKKLRDLIDEMLLEAAKEWGQENRGKVYMLLGRFQFRIDGCVDRLIEIGGCERLRKGAKAK
ncbi:hypothetical protein HKD24_06270 [Gluconobacter sp. LMG 31484]|uniref:Uncharacterized protein n=1 Tax=Gluconobacter vitians TaxID=2728102 RepID=A0ABR9Y4I4_9PROT|nr:hypothetical protein [Gluconobacter vitians]MBF0858818.1 hypothetical protein [Gluconobacter vitians]